MSTTWNPSDKNANITLSNGDLTATGPSGNVDSLVRSTTFKSSGKWYFEITIGVNTGPNENGCGFADSTASLTAYMASNTHSMGLYAGAQGFWADGTSRTYPNLPSFGTAGDVIQFAIDMAGTVWVGVNGSYGAGNDPATATGGLAYGAYFTPTGGDIYIVADAVENESYTLVFSPNFTYTPPSGFSAWDSSAPSFDASKGMFLLARG